ncbi:phosphotransferase family protein [Pelagirhabdus alkalitolerans]|nr:phosphotransferase family protein [Pelagirhabdus alkalitolerans]
MLGDGWTIQSAGGSTGEAYYAKSDQKQLFLKRNSSPFLAVLSAQGIVPKLVWTKRLENGDVITAQEWLEGEELNAETIKHPRVASLLGQIHHSTELLDMLTRMGKKPMDASYLIQELRNRIKWQSSHQYATLIYQGLKYMETHLDVALDVKPVVCHCDLNHNNWLYSNRDQLYLIDWDNAEIGDPAIDLSMLFSRYIPFDEWENWLTDYGVKSSQSLYIRIYWYMIYQLISDMYQLQDHHTLQESAEELELILQRTHQLLR